MALTLNIRFDPVQLAAIFAKFDELLLAITSTEIDPEKVKALTEQLRQSGSALAAVVASQTKPLTK